MDFGNPELLHDFSPYVLIYKNGRVERLKGNDVVPPSLDPKTNVECKDVVYSPENALSARIYIPKDTNQNQKLPLLVYFHGGAFCIETAFSPTFHNFLSPLVAEANIILVSVDYRRASEHPVPCAHNDSWTALEWVANHVSGKGPENWLNSHADFQRVYFGGDSAGANIAHHMGMKHGRQKLEGVNVKGVILCQPYFWGKEPVGDETKDVGTRTNLEKLWRLACPTTSGTDDPWINPMFGSNLAQMGCTRVLVFVAEKDLLRDRGRYYCEKLKESGWGGDVEVIQSKGETHVFHLHNPTCENAASMRKKLAAFINDQDKA